jgi:hypothetical protein
MPRTIWSAAISFGLGACCESGSRPWMITFRGAWRFDDGQWVRLEPLLPPGKKPGRPQTWRRGQLIDGIRRRTRAGAPWRDVPERYGPWDRAYDLFRRWQRDGT